MLVQRREHIFYARKLHTRTANRDPTFNFQLVQHTPLVKRYEANIARVQYGFHVFARWLRRIE